MPLIDFFDPHPGFKPVDQKASCNHVALNACFGLPFAARGTRHRRGANDGQEDQSGPQVHAVLHSSLRPSNERLTHAARDYAPHGGSVQDTYPNPSARAEPFGG